VHMQHRLAEGRLDERGRTRGAWLRGALLDDFLQTDALVMLRCERGEHR